MMITMMMGTQSDRGPLVKIYLSLSNGKHADAHVNAPSTHEKVLHRLTEIDLISRSPTTGVRRTGKLATGPPKIVTITTAVLSYQQQRQDMSFSVLQRQNAAVITSNIARRIN